MKGWWKNPVFWGVVATIAIAVFAFSLGVSQECPALGSCKSRFVIFWESTPNEIGDTLAGFAGALAFVWIIVTVWLQSIELAAQREELQLTRDEIAGQRKATEEMAKSLAAQASVFKEEQRQRVEKKASDLLNQKLMSVIDFVDNGQFPHWQFVIPNPDGGVSKGGLRLIDTLPTKVGFAGRFEYLCKYIIHRYAELDERLSKGHIPDLPEQNQNLNKLLDYFSEVIDLESDLSAANNEMMRRFRVRDAMETIQAVCSSDKYWKIQ